MLLNAVVHRDYKHSTDIVIKIFDDRIIFINPGILYGSLKLQDLEKDDYVSSIRNKLLAEAFYLMGDIERYGTGFVRIRKILKDHKQIAFDMEETGDFFQARLTCSELEASRAGEGINEGINRLVSYIRQNSGKRIPEISKDLNVPAKALERWIKSANERNLIEFRGSKKTGGYFLAIE